MNSYIAKPQHFSFIRETFALRRAWQSEFMEYVMQISWLPAYDGLHDFKMLWTLSEYSCFLAVKRRQSCPRNIINLSECECSRNFTSKLLKLLFSRRYSFAKFKIQRLRKHGILVLGNHPFLNVKIMGIYRYVNTAKHFVLPDFKVSERSPKFAIAVRVVIVVSAYRQQPCWHRVRVVSDYVDIVSAWFTTMRHGFRVTSCPSSQQFHCPRSWYWNNF